MRTVQNLATSKNDLWIDYLAAGPVARAQIVQELKQVGLLRHWHISASKHGYNLQMAKAPLRDIFLKVMPETAHYFGIKSSTT